jgi:SNF2 family DNA or RNA helicase
MALKRDVVFTSYDLLKRDIESYEEAEFRFVVIDDAQYIKNQNTQNAKAVKRLKGGTRIALTGTPIENSLAELWSIFDFLMPGYLYTYNHFKSKYETRITKKNDSAASERLRELVRPFILRRLKGSVLKELPEKIESVSYSTMSDEQRKLYIAAMAQAKKDLSAKLEESGAAQSRIMILAALTRLRQICCDPSLVYDGYGGGSAKLDACMELIASCIDGGHRILLFSQFTSMLAIIEERISADGIPYCILTGSTPKTERLRLVNSFNDGDTPIFLISLKAGGTGLNLTGADIVIHYDPWWNVSAQNQATDRAHRIGQTNAVQVFKLIAKDSVEERILEMQAKKAALADAVIEEGGGELAALTEEELLSLFSE